MTTSLFAFRMSLVSFFIPFAFAFDVSLLAEGTTSRVLLGSIPLLLGTSAWAVGLVGYLRGDMSWAERGLIALASLVLIFTPTGTFWWGVGLGGVIVMLSWPLLVRPLFRHAREETEQWNKSSSVAVRHGPNR